MKTVVFCLPKKQHISANWKVAVSFTITVTYQKQVNQLSLLLYETTLHCTVLISGMNTEMKISLLPTHAELTEEGYQFLN